MSCSFTRVQNKIAHPRTRNITDLSFTAYLVQINIFTNRQTQMPKNQPYDRCLQLPLETETIVRRTGRKEIVDIKRSHRFPNSCSCGFGSIVQMVYEILGKK